MRWQRVAQAAIAVFVIGFIAVLVTTLGRDRTAPPPKAAPERQAPDATLENPGGGTQTIADPSGGRPFEIKFGSHLALPDGRQQLRNGVEVTINRRDRRFVVTAKEADLTVAQSESNEPLEQAVFRGDVVITGDDGLEVETAEMIYTAADDLMRIPGRVEFRKGRTTGSGREATYDQGRDVFWVRQEAHLQVAPGPDGSGSLEATATAIGLARRDHYLRLEGNGRIEGQDRVVEADDITIYLTEDDTNVRSMELRGNSRITGTTGTAQTMSARDIDMVYADDGRTLQSVRLVENAVVDLPGAAASAAKRIAASTIDMTLGPDGSTVTGLIANDRVNVRLPAEANAPAREIDASTLTASGGEAGLQSAAFGGGVKYRETRAAGRGVAAVERSADAQTLIVETEPGFGAIRKADFRGNVTFNDGPDFVAKAQQGVYDIAGDRLDLRPVKGLPGPPEPTVTDANVTVSARTIGFGLSTREMQAEIGVRSTITPRKDEQGSDKGRMPSMLADDEPVNVTADKLSYDGRNSAAVYSGNARLWQGSDTTIKGTTLTIDDRTGNLTATGGVTTTFLIRDRAAEGRGKPEPTIGTADAFSYDENKRLATYTGNAKLHAPQGDVTGEKIELFLEKDANELQRAEAYGANGKVQVREGHRLATGSRMTYTAADDRYLMIGAPVEITTAEKDGVCRLTRGSSATFTRATEQVDMEGLKGSNISMQTERLKSCPAELIR
jgi:lipopolysaccharide transport protein LptA